MTVRTKTRAEMESTTIRLSVYKDSEAENKNMSLDQRIVWNFKTKFLNMGINI